LDGDLLRNTIRYPLESITNIFICILILIIRVIKSRRMSWEGHVACMGEGRGAYRVLVGRPEGRRPLGRPRRRWEENIKMNLQEVGWGHGLD
jgi:hypothetical protein